MGTKALVALDTNHIKQYVFATDKLKEIRGASSLLDRFNRDKMVQLAKNLDVSAYRVYANGGSGLFLLEAEHARAFAEEVQWSCREMTDDAAAVTCVVLPLPPGAPEPLEEILKFPLRDTLDLLRSHLHMAKGCPPEILALTSHPFLRPCQACGVFYAEHADHSGAQDRDEEDALYCASCLLKRAEDMRVKRYISSFSPDDASPLWCKLLHILRDLNYDFPKGVSRPHDFNVFQGVTKNYIGLIYADANGMGKKIEKIPTLGEIKAFADTIDESIYQAVGEAIALHLPVAQFGLTNPEGEPAFPFDILLLGGDDVVMVTPASIALQVAQTIATRFYALTNGEPTEPPQAHTSSDSTSEQHSLSVGVVLAPIKYPFNLLRELAEDALKFAKKAGSSFDRASSLYDKTRINFMVMTGSLSQGFQRVYDTLSEKEGQGAREPVFYATLRPYTIEQLTQLLAFIKAGKALGLGRTKLHQLREAVLRKNLTTSLSESRAILVSWRANQRDFVVQQVYSLADDYQKRRRNADDPASTFPQVVFPWFLDGMEDNRSRYRSAILDFVELFDFVSGEEVEQHVTEQI